MSRYPEDGEEIVWSDGDEGLIWIAFGQVHFVLDKENYEGSMTPTEAREFAARLIAAAEKAEQKEKS